MLLKHSLGYLFGRGIPSIVNLAALGIYTQLIGPGEYGEFALVYGVVLLSDVILLQWVRLALLRFRPVHRDDRRFLSTIAAAFGIVGGGVSLLALTSVLSWPGGRSSTILLLGLGLFWIQGWFHLNLELARSDLSPKRFAMLGILRAVCVLVGSVLLIAQGFGSAALLVGAGIGTIVPLAATARSSWSGIRPSLVDYPTLRMFVAYGLPLSLTFAMSVVISKSDRLMLGWLDGIDSVGVYAVAYDLTERGVVFPLLVIALAGYPLMIRAMEQAGEGAARAQARENATWLLAFGLPAVIGSAMLSRNIAGSILGADFASSAGMVMPWIACGVMLGSFRAHFFDHSFHLSRRVLGLLWVTAPAALLNLILNLWLIPPLGITGAAYATLLSYAVGCVLSAYLGRRHFPLPWPWRDMGKVLVSSAAMVIVLLPLRDRSGWLALIAQLSVGGSVYLAAVYTLNVGGIRQRIVGARMKARQAS